MSASLNNSNAPINDDVYLHARKLFDECFGSTTDAKIHVGSGPGRVNLIGEHTDYNDGFVMPLAIERRCYAVGRFNNLNRFRMISQDLLSAENKKHEDNNSGVDPFEGPNKKRGLVDGSKAKVDDTISEFDLETLIAVNSTHAWHNYVRGVIAQYVKKGINIPPFDLAVAGNVPLGGGLSSSAALEVSVCMFLESYLGLSSNGVEKALICQKSEHEYANVPCGIMDQFISVLGQKDHCLLIDCRSNEFKLVSFSDPNVALIITNSNVKHSLSGGEYATRRAQCEEAVKLLKVHNPEIKALRDVTLDHLLHVRSEMDETVFQRALHVITENERTIKAAQCLSTGDYKTLGTLMNQSHISLKNDYEVSCDELDILVDIALSQKGVYGSRMTGGGFGGCTVTLVNAADVQVVKSNIEAAYRTRTGKVADTMITRPSQGAFSFTV